jgi:hypothetical protein
MLPVGNYVVKFNDVGSEYFYTSGKEQIHPLDFAQLSVTDENMYETRPYDPSINRSMAIYSEKDSESGPAGLTEAQTYTLINLPTNMTVTAQYTAANWNCGLYYLNLTLEKEWVDTAITDIPENAKVSFDVTATMKNNSAYPVIIR